MAVRTPPAAFRFQRLLLPLQGVVSSAPNPARAALNQPTSVAKAGSWKMPRSTCRAPERLGRRSRRPSGRIASRRSVMRAITKPNGFGDIQGVFGVCPVPSTERNRDVTSIKPRTAHHFGVISYTTPPFPEPPNSVVPYKLPAPSKVTSEKGFAPSNPPTKLCSIWPVHDRPEGSDSSNTVPRFRLPPKKVVP